MRAELVVLVARQVVQRLGEGIGMGDHAFVGRDLFAQHLPFKERWHDDRGCAGVFQAFD